jgi:glyoxylase-like metal-dependent hydrolase (beta-lactamase superfamily II)
MAVELAAGIWRLDLGWMPPFATNAYVIERDDLTLVDTGFPWNQTSIRDALGAAGYQVADIDRVLLTHYDLDHTGGLSRLAADLDAPVYIGARDARVAAGTANTQTLHHKSLFHRAARRLFPLPDELEIREVRDGDEIAGFTAYHTPGHNPGHMVYLHDDGVALLGDLVWEEDGELTPPFWLDSYDMRRVRESIRDLAARAPAFEVACMGHGTPITNGATDALERLVSRL